jgi:hypothetical protein
MVGLIQWLLITNSSLCLLLPSFLVLGEFTGGDRHDVQIGTGVLLQTS